MNPKIQQKLNDLLDFAKKNNLMEVAWQDKGLRIAFRRGIAPAPVTSTAPSASSNGEAVTEALEKIKSPIVGTFRRSISKNRPPMVMKGNKIKPGDRLGVVECMKIPTEVVSYVNGVIKEVLVEEGESVEYGQALFSILVNSRGATNGKKVV